MKVRKGLIFGVVLLLAVDVVWVGSAGISRHLFHDDHYKKPLFWTYFKTSLFSIYLSAFLFWCPWQRMCWEGFRELRWWVRKGRKGERQSICTMMRCTSGLQPPVSPDGVEVDTSCGVHVDETTGQCTPNHSDNPTQEDCVHIQAGNNDQDSCVEEDIAAVQLRIPRELHTISDTDSSHKHSQHKPTIDKSCSSDGIESESEQSEGCPARQEEGSGGGGGNRHARVVDGHIFFHTASLNDDSCPINPDLEICKLVGPPEFKPLNCSLSEEDRCKTGPLPSCATKCCKVRFKRTIEVREAKSNVINNDREHSKGPAPLMPVWKVASLSLVFGIVWFFANYLYALALVSKSVALVNTLSSMSSVFVMLMAALPVLHRAPGDRITLSRFLISILSVGGAALVSISDSTETEHKYWSAGALISLASAFLYAVYLVLLKKLVHNPDTLELPMFFGFVGLFNTVLLLPLVLIWHYTGLEEFEWPPSPDVWTLLLVNGFVGTVISELLWLGGVFLTSPLVGTLSLALVTPLSIAYSVLIGQNPFSVSFFVGALVIVVCFVAVTVLDHFGSWDPLWALLKKTVTAARDYRAHKDYESLSEESRRLIDNEYSSDQCVG